MILPLPFNAGVTGMLHPAWLPLGCVGFLSGHEEAGKYTVLERVEQSIGLMK